jgi:hypothetical protein
VKGWFIPRERRHWTTKWSGEELSMIEIENTEKMSTSPYPMVLLTYWETNLYSAYRNFL